MRFVATSLLNSSALAFATALYAPPTRLGWADLLFYLAAGVAMTAAHDLFVVLPLKSEVARQKGLCAHYVEQARQRDERIDALESEINESSRAHAACIMHSNYLQAVLDSMNRVASGA